MCLYILYRCWNIISSHQELSTGGFTSIDVVVNSGLSFSSHLCCWNVVLKMLIQLKCVCPAQVHNANILHSQLGFIVRFSSMSVPMTFLHDFIWLLLPQGKFMFSFFLVFFFLFFANVLLVLKLWHTQKATKHPDVSVFFLLPPCY